MVGFYVSANLLKDFLQNKVKEYEDKIADR